MRLITLFLLLLSISFSAQSQSSACAEGGCIVNAGQDQIICADGLLELHGEDNADFAQPLNVRWEASATNPSTLVIEAPEALSTTVSTTTGGDYLPGEYTFSLIVTCNDGSTSCNETTVTVTELPNIQLLIPEEPACSNTIFLARSEELPEGATELLAFSPANNVSVEEVDGGFLVTRNPNAFWTCQTEFVYNVFAGNSCRRGQTGTIQITANTTTTSLTPVGVKCVNGMVEGLLDIRDYNIGCGEVKIAAISTPEGVQAEDVQFIATKSFRRYSFSAPAGDYTFEVTISSICGVTSATTTVECPDVDTGICSRITVAQSVLTRRMCNDFTDVGTVQLAIPFFENATYEIVPFHTIPEWLSVTLNFDGAFTTVTFSGDRPASNFYNTAFFKVKIFNDLNPECPPVEFSTIVNVPRPLQILSDRVNINCGMGSIYAISDNIRIPTFGRFTVLSSPDGYEGITTGNLGLNSDLLQLSEFGTYVIEYVDLTGGFDNLLDQGVRCFASETFTIVVDDIPSIDAGSDATICESKVQLNGSTPRNAAGLAVDINILWEPVANYPGVIISDPTIRNPIITGLEPGQSYTFSYSFPGDPNCAKEDFVTITVEKDCDETVPLTCDISLKFRCTSCGCGEPISIVHLLDSNGDRFERGTFSVTWLRNGEPTPIGVNSNSLISHYEGPLVVTAQVTFVLDNGDKCTIEESIAVTCGDDCPEVSFEYATDDCTKDYFYGEVTVVDAAGHPVLNAGIDWYADETYDDNPYMVFSMPGEVIPVVIDYAWRKGCTFEMDFVPECFKGKDSDKLANVDNIFSPLKAAGIYPNPASQDEQVSIHFGEYAPSSLSITDMNGREVFQTTIAKEALDYHLSPTSLPTGVMIAVLRDETGKVLTSKRFVVQ